jgi:hypothetical protein
MWRVLVSPRLHNARIPHFVEEADNDIVLLHTKSIKVFSDYPCQVILGLSSELALSGHCRGT